MNKVITTTLHYYYYNLENGNDREVYDQLRKRLRAAGLHKFAAWGFEKEFRQFDGQEIPLETNHIFTNQWNTAPMGESENGYRIFDWREAYYPNKNIKEGYWLVPTHEMIGIRKNVHSCGYCGKQTIGKLQEFCQKCLGSEYLEESQLHLLRMLPLSNYRQKRRELSQSEKDELLPLYREAQKRGVIARNAKKLERDKGIIESKYQNALLEYQGYTWLFDHGITFDFSNVIFYSHKNLWVFGWQKSLDDTQKTELKKSLAKFPYNFEIK